MDTGLTDEENTGQGKEPKNSRGGDLKPAHRREVWRGKVSASVAAHHQPTDVHPNAAVTQPSDLERAHRDVDIERVAHPPADHPFEPVLYIRPPPIQPETHEAHKDQRTNNRRPRHSVSGALPGRLPQVEWEEKLSGSSSGLGQRSPNHCFKAVVLTPGDLKRNSHTFGSPSGSASTRGGQRATGFRLFETADRGDNLRYCTTTRLRLVNWGRG